MKRGETNVAALLCEMQPRLAQEYYVFCTLDEEVFSRLVVRPLGVFHETEGVTVILQEEEAETLELPASSTFALITLAVHSDLLAVGFLASVAARLAEANISINVISAFYHDHLFVPAGDAHRAMDVLTTLAQEAVRNQT